jgi:phosphinothricin acetyltransferase
MGDLPILRAAEEADVASARRIYNRYVRESTATFHCRIQSEEDFRKKFLLPLPHGAIVAIDPQEHTLLGYTLLSPFIDRCAARWSSEVAIYLDASACGTGIGTRLLTAADEQARKHRMRTIVAVISSENTGSCRFFRRNGYRHCGSIDAVAQKFGRRLGIEYYQKIFPTPGLDPEGIAAEL